jgi:hypothetical protein
MMNMTSARKKMSKLNRKRALIRITRELQYILSKSQDEPNEKDLRKAIFHTAQALQQYD